jgi:isopenicillin-N epimerase
MHTLREPAVDPSLWPLDPKVVFLNHGSFGSCPRAVLAFQNEIRARFEGRPIQFLARELEGLLDQARSRLAEFVEADPQDLVFVTNATTGVNTVLRSLPWKSDDEFLVTDYEYNACRNALDFAARQSGARVAVAKIPFPLRSEDEIVDAILARVSERTRLLLVDHVTSQTGIVMPLDRLIPEMTSRGVDTLIDGAHAPGMIPLDVRRLGAAYYTGNCHKWICAPKGAGFLYVRRDRQAAIRPLVISHGANSPRKDRSRYLIEFDWTGTWDPSAYLSVPESLRYVGSLLPGGWPEVMAHNRTLALAARRILCEALAVDIPCPDDLIGSLASIPLPDAPKDQVLTSPLYDDPIQERLRNEYAIEVPIVPWPEPPKRVLRVSAQLYNALPQYELLARVVRELV